MPLDPGTRLGPYEIVSAIGAGGMGDVYKARDTRLDRIVAIKVLRQQMAGDARRRARFDREARLISKLNHPHICTLYDVGEHESATYLVLELLEGETLASRLERFQTQPLTLTAALTVGVEIAKALEVAHRGGIVHRDLKPSNIMLTATGATLLDFGISRSVEEGQSSQTVTAEGTLLGTVQYMAPEQLEGREADRRSDIFAFGAVLMKWSPVSGHSGVRVRPA
jgi:serine/threonine protein kinase